MDLKKYKIKKGQKWTNPADTKEYGEDSVVDLPEAKGDTLIEMGVAEKVADAGDVKSALDEAMAGFEAAAEKAMTRAVAKAAEGFSFKGGKIAAGNAPQDEEHGGFESFGEFAVANKSFYTGRGVSEKMAPWLNRCKAMDQKAPTGMGEISGAEGGLTIPDAYATGIWKRALRGSAILSKIDMQYIDGNTLILLQETGDTEAAGVRNAGVRGYWLGEGGQITASKPTFRPMALRLKKLGVVVYASDELLEDSPMTVGTYLEEKAGDEIGFQAGDALINGNGVEKPLGVLAAPCLVTVTKKTDQQATTFVADNVSKMWSRMWSLSRANAIWCLNQDVEPQLDILSVGLGVSGQLVFMPPGGLSASPNGSLKGKPIEPTPWSPTLGTAGDVLLADWSQYQGIAKRAGIQQASSIHLRFLEAETAFRFIYRMDGRPKWAAALTPFTGTANTLSPFVVVETRS